MCATVPDVNAPRVVFETGRADLIAIAKSVLVSANVESGTRGEGVQELFGWGRFPFGANVAMGAVQILVSAEDAEDARALLAGVGAPDGAVIPEGAEVEAIDVSAATPMARYAGPVGKATALLILGYWALPVIVIAWQWLLDALALIVNPA